MIKGNYTQSGGLKVLQKDAEVIQNEAHEAIEQMIAALGSGYVLSGIEVTANPDFTLDLTAGYVVLDGKILRFDGATNVDVTSSSKYLKKGPLIQTSERTYYNGTQRFVFEEYKAVVTSISGGTESLAISTTILRYAEFATYFINIPILKQRIALPANGPWRVVGSAGQPTFGTGWTNASMPLNSVSVETGSPVSFMKDANNFIHLRGYAAYTGADNVPIFILPEGFRPNAHVVLPTFSLGISENNVDTIVKPNGEVFCANNVINAQDPVLGLESVVFFAG